MINLEYQLSKPYTFEDLECSLEARMRQCRQLELDNKRLQDELLDQRYDLNKTKEKLLREKIINRVAIEGNAQEAIDYYFSNPHTTIEEEDYFYCFIDEGDYIVGAFMWVADTIQARRKAYKAFYRYAEKVNKPIQYTGVKNVFANNSIQIDEKVWQFVIKK